MSLTKIEIDFQNAQAQAKRLEDVADNMKRLADQQIADTIREMSSCWKGETAAAYFGKAEKVKQDIADTAKALYAVASNIRAQARRIYDAEMQAISLTQPK